MMTLNSFGRHLAEILSQSKERSLQWQRSRDEGAMVHVASAGKTVTAAYEQLRNAAEYAEEHLLLQRAISRFYRRYFLSRDQNAINDSAEELIFELTLAGYLSNDTVPEKLLPTINETVREYHKAFKELSAEHRKHANAWVVDVMAVTIERMLSDSSKQDGFTQFAYDYFYESLEPSRALNGASPEDYALSLFIAVNHTLLKADAAIIRAGLLARYGVSPKDSQAFVQTNERIDSLLFSETTEKLTRVVDRHSGPLRILWRMIDTRDNTAEIIHTPSAFLAAYDGQVDTEYGRINQKIRQGVTKSIAFLIVTKLVIGLVIEVPYDKWAHGEIVWLPLAVNLLFPPIYMVLLSSMMKMPGAANTQALSRHIEHILYSEQPPKIAVGRSEKSYSGIFSAIYALLFLVVFGSATWLLVQIGFSAVHLAIFFVFLSTASFLGFRLTRMVREVEVVDGDQNALTIVRDIILPFVVVGHWISDKYGKFNIMALILDMAIELPLKTFLRLGRQWTTFISSKKDEL